MVTWLILAYSLPSEPSAARVYVWRKLKKLGAATIFEAVWVLPHSPRSHEQFQWLVAEIQEMGGDAMFWSAQSELSTQEKDLIRCFTQQVDSSYQAILDKLELPKPDLITLSQEYQQTVHRDYFHSTLGQKVHQRLLATRGEKL